MAENEQKEGRILVIDDEETIRFAVRMILEHAQYEVLEAEDGRAGLQTVEESVPDLVLCDIEMKETDGISTLKMFRAGDSTKDIPFIFLTGMDPHRYRRLGMSLGADDFLTKPFDENDLLQAIRARLARKKELTERHEKRIGELIRNITHALPHELRTPLFGILGFADMLTDESSPSPEEVSRIGANIRKSAERLHSTLEKFWMLVNLELSGAEPQGASGRVTEGAHLLLKTASREIAQRFKRDADLKLEAEECTIRTDMESFDWIVRELAENACKFSPKGTPIEIALRGNGEHIGLTVRDSGRGMTNEQIESIAAFRQFDREKYEQQGMGLGLTLVRMLAERCGGSMTIESAGAGGTTVRVLIPKA